MGLIIQCITFYNSQPHKKGNRHGDLQGLLQDLLVIFCIFLTTDSERGTGW